MKNQLNLIKFYVSLREGKAFRRLRGNNMGFNVLKLFEESLRPNQDGESHFVGSPLVLGRVGRRRKDDAPERVDSGQIKNLTSSGILNYTP